MNKKDAASDGDEPLDLTRYFELLWRRRVVIILITLAGGLAGFAYSRMTPPVYRGTARLAITPDSNSGGPIAIYQASLLNEAVIAAAIAEIEAGGGGAVLTVANVQAGISSRTASPGNTLIVEANAGSPDAAGRLAGAIARRALVAYREAEDKALDVAQEKLRTEVDMAERVVAQSRAAWLAFRQKNPGEVLRADTEVFIAQGAELPKLLADIRAEQGRLRAARALSSSEQVAASQIRLAGLEARRDYLLGSGSPGESSAPPTKAEFEHLQLRADFIRALRVRDQVSDEAVAALRHRMSRPTILRFLDEAPGRLSSRRTSSYVSRGLAAGVMFGVFGVLFLDLLVVPLFRRST